MLFLTEIASEHLISFVASVVAVIFTALFILVHLLIFSFIEKRKKKQVKNRIIAQIRSNKAVQSSKVREAFNSLNDSK